MYKILYPKGYEKDLSKIPSKYRIFILKMVFKLKENPFPNGIKKLKGKKNYYRLRFGIFRLVYEIKGDVLIIKIIKIGHRRNVYEKL